MTEKNKQREYFGSRDGRPLLEWLNKTALKADEESLMALDRVTEILTLVSAIQDSAFELKAEGDWTHKPKAIKNLEGALNLRLASYEFVYGVDLSQPQPLVWVLKSIDELSSYKGETSAVYCIIELAKMGLTGKIRRCEQCHKFFFARLPAQRFHDSVCADKFWRNSPERKAQKRKKAREYYNLHKNKNTR